MQEFAGFLVGLAVKGNKKPRFNGAFFYSSCVNKSLNQGHSAIF